MEQQVWMLKRNCSLSPRQLGRAYVALCLLSLAVASLCFLMGVWQIIFFTILELSAVALAFLAYARHATDHEQIALSQDCLLIEQVDGSRTARVRLDPKWARVDMPVAPHDLIHVEACGVGVEVGRFVTAGRRREVARELQRRVAAARGLRHAA